MGRWTHANEIHSEEDILFNFTSYPYNNEINAALTPHVEVLIILLTDVRLDILAKKLNIPVLHYICSGNSKSNSTQLGRKRKHDTVKAGVVPHSGNLSLEDQARVANWFAANVKGARSDTTKWLGRFPLTHAFTLLLLHRHRATFENKNEFPHTEDESTQHQWLLQTSWEFQVNEVGPTHVDVDRTCLAELEERMFERSKEAGRAGDYQWGLDSGHHQDRWNPYENVPAFWGHGDFDGSESDAEVRNNSTTL